MNKRFKAVIVEQTGDSVQSSVKEIDRETLPKSDVLIKVEYTGVNYKDGLAASADGKIVNQYPFIPGIDLAGTVVESGDERFKAGDAVIATSYEIGVSHFGGFSEYASIPADWIVPLPEGLTLKESMIIGTAGFTAALSISRLEKNGLRKEDGEVLVTGATGGVGSLAVTMLSGLGYKVAASTGKQSEHDYLKMLGAERIISREAVYNGKVKALDKEKWAAAVDPVGGEPLAALLGQIKYMGSVAVSGLTAGGSVPTTVFPFILRSVNLLGIDSVYCPMEERKMVWERLASDLKPEKFAEITEEIVMDDVPDALKKILTGTVRGRIIVKI
ncbi:acrylyl-CoA reductase family protein [Corticicoccus populi]|uniref:Acryloyl-CoA reductase n=1 Tax=Corticicoccus populi TaxID=1812821 RepID=A0ABW5WY27_9STAP